MNPLGKIFFGVMLALSCIALITFLYLIIANAHLKTELAQSQANDTACHLANDEFVTQTKRQNQAIEELKADTLLRQRNALASEASAQKIAQAYTRAAVKLTARKASSDICKSSKNLIDDYMKDAK